MRGSPIAQLQWLLGAAFMAVLAYLWVGADLRPKNVHWQAPAPQFAQLQALLALPPAPQRALAEDSAALLMMQERPLFVLGRRPPPPAPAPQVAPSPEKNSWDKAVLVGVFSGAASGIIFRREGKDHRLLLNQSFEGWTLQSVAPHQARLQRGTQTLELVLQKAPASALGNPAAVPPRARPQSAPVRVQPPARPSGPPSTQGQSTPPLEQPVFGGSVR